MAVVIGLLVRTRAFGRGRIGFTPFTLTTATRTHFYPYDFSTGTIELHRIDNDDVTSVWSSATLMGAGWTDLLPLEMYDGSRFLLLHSSVSGILRVFRIRNDGQGLEYASAWMVVRITCDTVGRFWVRARPSKRCMRTSPDYKVSGSLPRKFGCIRPVSWQQRPRMHLQ